MTAQPGGTRRGRLPAVLADTLQTAAGRGHRVDPVVAGAGGPAGNARLTAWTGLVLLALSIAELITLIDVTGLISWHIAIGTLLIPPALLKTASTGWRIARYYRHDPLYRRAGPPPMILRILGPAVVAATLALLASGLVLILLGRHDSSTVLISAFGQRVDWITLHKGLFLVWAAATGTHVLARLVPALQLTLITRLGGPTVDGTMRRTAVLAATLALAVLVSVLVLSASSSWH